jgi:hypothetical protein
MLKTAKKKAFTLFALTLLTTSILLVGINSPTVALPTDGLIYLDGPPLVPIHLHGPPLTPVHMHSLIGVMGIDWDPYEPWFTPWHELYPDYCEIWTFTSWEDNGNGYLDPSDQIDLTNDITQEVRWFHVDIVTVTMLLVHEQTGEPIYVEYKDPTWNPPLDPLDPRIPMPICTWWHEIWPVYHGVLGGMPYHIIDWIDNGNGYLDFCDYIMFEPWFGEWWHVEEYATDLILNEKVMEPYEIEWHELYPDFCNLYNVSDWEEPPEDPFPDRLSPSDQIYAFDQIGAEWNWYYVDRVTFTMLVSNETNPDDLMYIEYKGPFETMYDIKTTVINSTWHEVYPIYCPSYNITDWTDNCNGVLDFCDYIELHDLYADIYYGWWHVEELSIDIVLNEKIDDPTGIIWHELYPDCCINDYETLEWEDNGDGLLNPCDNITLALLPSGLTYKYHVENMTLTLNLTIEDMLGDPPFTIGERIYIEYLAAVYFSWEWLYYPKTHPEYTDWEVVCPVDRFGYPLTIENWYDNCNGVLSYCDMLELLSPDGALWCHVDEVAVDITVKKIIEEPPPPPPWYKKPPYPDYAPSGMPDFDQKQDGWFHPMVGWTWCGPVASANSMWWLDSEFEPNTIPPPAIIDNFPLVTSYNPGVWDDHDVKNVALLVQDLAWWMDTDGIRTGFPHTGTFWWDMHWGIEQYLIQQGVADLFEVHSMEFPEFFWIEEEIYRCQDVVLLLEFWDEATGERWIYDPGGEGGHYVTCAGVNSTTMELLISDPWQDAAEAGWPGHVPIPHTYPHTVDVHNDTRYVSHDAYTVALSPSPYGMTWELLGYLQSPGYGWAPTWHAFITATVVTSPLAVHDVAVTDLTSCYGSTILTQNFTYTVNTTVTNEGDFAETFTLTLYWNNTNVINSTLVSLAIGETKVVQLDWNTTGLQRYMNYTLRAYATPVPGETDTADNTFDDPRILMMVYTGDINNDKKVDILDIASIAKLFGVIHPDPAYNPNMDIDCNGKIDIMDVALAAKQFGYVEPP